jgi:nucleoside 2-deoxyribosyltransferase
MFNGAQYKNVLTTYKVYLSGPITGLNYDDGNYWRDQVTARLNDNITPLNPLRCKEWARKHGIIYDTMGRGHPWMATDEFIGTRDHWDTVRSELVLVNLLGALQVSVGTVLEIGMAHARGVPIILVMEDEGNCHEHGMIRAYSTMRFNNLDAAVDCVNALLSV